MVAIACTGYELGSAREEVPGICYPRSKNFRQSRKGSEFSQHGNSEFSQHGNFAPNVFFPRRVRGRPICLPAMAPSVAARAGFWIEFFPSGLQLVSLPAYLELGILGTFATRVGKPKSFPAGCFPLPRSREAIEFIRMGPRGHHSKEQNGTEKNCPERAGFQFEELKREMRNGDGKFFPGSSA